MLRKIWKAIINDEDYKDLAHKTAKHLEKRDRAFSVNYRVSTENELLKDIERADLFLDIITPYHFRDMDEIDRSYYFEDGTATINYRVNYHTNLKDDEFVKRQVRKIVDEINPRNKSAFETVIAVNDYFCTNYRYEEQTENSPYIPFTILLEKKGVCQGFALLALKIFEEIGIPVQYVSGYANRGRHAWNMIQLEDEWYHIDFTWNLPSGQVNDGFYYSYFLLSDESISKDHDFDTNYYPLCVSNQFEFLKLTNTYAICDSFIYFANKDDDFKLYMKNLKSPQPIQKVLNSRVQGLSYNNAHLYFSNYSHSGLL